VREEHVLDALRGAGTEVHEGAVGAGTGMVAFGFKGGIGTASRLVETAGGRFVVGSLVLTNFGRRRDLLLCGVPVGRMLPDGGRPERDGGGSVVVIIATDAPLDARQLTRAARRASVGLARTGAPMAGESGDFAVAFSTGPAAERDASVVAGRRLGERLLDELFAGVAECVEESVLSSLFVAETTRGRRGRVVEALPVDHVVDLLRSRGLLSV